MSTSAVPQSVEDALRYPTGRFHRPRGPLTDSQRREMIDVISRTPNDLRSAVRGLSDSQLDTPYRPGGWTVRQVVHHVPDSHMNAFIRFKLALTEDTPMIKPYDEAEWAKLTDVRDTPIETSLTLLASLHDRWVRLLRGMAPADFGRQINHPEWDAPLPLDAVLALYAWHGPHHVAHITSLKQRQSWS
jgi:DinB family protein